MAAALINPINLNNSYISQMCNDKNVTRDKWVVSLVNRMAHAVIVVEGLDPINHALHPVRAVHIICTYLEDDIQRRDIYLHFLRGTGIPIIGQQIGYYDVQAQENYDPRPQDQKSLCEQVNKQGFISRIRHYEGPNYDTIEERDCRLYNRKSWYTSFELATLMIVDIKARALFLESEMEAGRGSPYPFQLVGSHSVVNLCGGSLGGNQGENCITWAEKRLIIAHVGNGSKPKDVLVAHPATHTKGGCQIC